MSEAALRQLTLAVRNWGRWGPDNPVHAMFRDGGDAPRTPADVAAKEGYEGDANSRFSFASGCRASIA